MDYLAYSLIVVDCENEVWTVWIFRNGANFSIQVHLVGDKVYYKYILHVKSLTNIGYLRGKVVNRE